MTSIIKVDQIQTAAGGVPTAGDLGIDTTGTVLEHLEGYCDGRTVGGVVFPTVSSWTAFNTTTYTDVAGSTIAYTPPSDATTVIYKFTFSYYGSTNGGLSHWRSYIDTDEVTIGRTTLAANYQTTNLYDHRIQTLTLPISVGDTQDVANGNLSSWTTPKTIKLMARAHSENYYFSLHKNRWWNGTGASGSDLVRIPTLSITAIR
jgi:hypothetical protein